MLASPFSKIYNDSGNTSFVLLLYVNANDDFKKSYSLSGNVNNLHQSIQNIVKEPQVLDISNNVINTDISLSLIHISEPTRPY